MLQLDMEEFFLFLEKKGFLALFQETKHIQQSCSIDRFGSEKRIRSTPAKVQSKLQTHD